MAFPAAAGHQPALPEGGHQLRCAHAGPTRLHDHPGIPGDSGPPSWTPAPRFSVIWPPGVRSVPRANQVSDLPTSSPARTHIAAFQALRVIAGTEPFLAPRVS